MLDQAVRLGFTLAEVLITLGIIGIVAALTLPSLINDIQDKQFKAKWKKEYSVISNAYFKAFLDSEPPNLKQTILPDSNYFTLASKQIYTGISKNLKTTYYCVTEALEGNACVSSLGVDIVSPKCSSYNGDRKNTRCMYNGGGGYADLVDGARLYFHSYFWNYPEILVDVNGPANPNVVGRDMFIIIFRDNKVIPGGAKGYEFKGCTKNVQSTQSYIGADQFAGSGCGEKFLRE